MELEEILKIQNKLVDDRKNYPILIGETYKKARELLKKFLINYQFEIPNEENIEEELNIYKYEVTGEQDLDELLEQIRIIIILAHKKNCQISNIIDAI